MWPTLREGYRVRFRPVPPEILEVGAIVVLRGRGRQGELRYKVHRLLDRVGPFFLEAGDNAFSSSLVHPRDILGLVERVWDRAGRPVKLPPGMPLAPARFQFFRLCAHGFVFAHEMKDRVVGRRRSWLLWQASALYRASLRTLGVEVPLVQPR